MMVFLKRFEFHEGHLMPEDAQKNVLDWINSNVAPDNVISITEIITIGSYIITVWFSDTN